MAELLYGVHRSADPEKNRGRLDIFLIDIRVVAITHEIVEVFAIEKARLASLGTPAADFDLLIGATAVNHSLTLVTSNTRHFRRLKDLKLEDWTR